MELSQPDFEPEPAFSVTDWAARVHALIDQGKREADPPRSARQVEAGNDHEASTEKIPVLQN